MPPSASSDQNAPTSVVNGSVDGDAVNPSMNDSNTKAAELDANASPLVVVFSRTYLRTTCLTLVVWLTLIIIYFGLTLHLSNLGGNIYVNTVSVTRNGLWPQRPPPPCFCSLRQGVIRSWHLQTYLDIPDKFSELSAVVGRSPSLCSHWFPLMFCIQTKTMKSIDICISITQTDTHTQSYMDIHSHLR